MLRRTSLESDVGSHLHGAGEELLVPGDEKDMLLQHQADVDEEEVLEREVVEDEVRT